MAQTLKVRPSGISGIVYAFLLGVFSLLCQVLIIRRVLSVFSGNELIIGIILALWIAFTSLGSLLVSRFRTDEKGLGLTFILIGFGFQLIFSVSWFVYPVFGLQFGEVIPLPFTIVCLTFLLLPVALLFGAQFPMIVSVFKQPASKTYGLESIGAFTGGMLFTFILAGRVSDGALVLAISLITVFAGIILLKRPVFLVLLIIPVLLYTALPESEKAVFGSDVLQKLQSKHGEIIVTSTKGQKNFYLSGKLQFSYPEPQTEEISAHVPSLFTAPEKVLIIGGSPGILREYLKLGAKEIVYVEINQRLLKASLNYLNERDRKMITDSRKVGFVYADARNFLLRQRGAFDVIVLNTTVPETASLNRYFTKEFFQLIKKHLKEKGVLLVRLKAVPGYMGNAMARLNSSIFNTLKAVFPYVEVTSMEYALCIASKRLLNASPDVLKEVFRQKRTDTVYFNSSIIEDMFSPFKKMRFIELLDRKTGINTDRHPVAYLYNIILWSEANGGAFIRFFIDLKRGFLMFLGSALGVFLLIIGSKGRQSEYTVVFTTGFVTISIVSLSVLLFQALKGYIYEQIGLITGLYMVGSAIGAWGAQRVTPTSRGLFISEAAFLMLLISYLFASRDVSGLYLCVLFSGILGGLLFSLSAMVNEDVSVLYATDLAGASGGAVLSTLFLFPLFGLYYTIGFLIYLKLISLFLLYKR